ncbi:uncharacterized protein TOT_010000190 [Theileria orientalis strain Shintoku]|uniref:WD40 repeat-containing protein SMU1 n=1 Tax=Theileria orientalis strain Shintoku TaxID=869250 RepID=J7MC09_THEOR|nr:uncharacterized protein TOT_010000190 [Theileria orientalis strain Shintoku]BAM38722.1 uncharacterized protein TOT_010000190 [Theileria orientalis strain Shintoku]|eukprot:XP_009689023.1 uncharacterized protein TOT_010000190 [Theileria orientalis strain Shintoku]
MDRNLDVSSEDVVKLILQYLKENGLNKTLLVMQEETGVSLNSVSNIESLIADAQMGRWSQVLDAIDTMKLSQDTLYKLYDQIVRELVDLKESKLALLLLESCTPLISMQKTDPDNYRRLLDLCRNRPSDSKEIYAGLSTDSSHQHLTKEKKRNIVAEALAKDIEYVPQSRLLALIGMALKWQNHLGLIPPGDRFDVFKSTSKTSDESTQFAKNINKIIKFAENSHPECAVFTPNGQYLLSGYPFSFTIHFRSSDGFIEVWNWSVGALDTELSYQAQDHFMLHDTLITCLAVSRDSEVLASGDQRGNIKIWKIGTGECLKSMNNSHNGAVTCATFSRDSSNLLTGSFDSLARIHGLKSGKPLKEFRGHTSIVNTAVYSNDGTKVITGSSDGFVKVWDSRSCECLKSFPAFTQRENDDPEGPLISKSVNTIVNLAGQNDLFLVCSKSPVLKVFNLSGNCLRQFTPEEVENVSFLDVSGTRFEIQLPLASKRSEWIYALGDDDQLYCFNYKSGKLDNVHDKEAIGVTHHPYSSFLASWGLDRTIKILCP